MELKAQAQVIQFMNPLLGRLYESKSRSKTKHPSVPLQERRRTSSQQRPLVPRIGSHRVKLQALPQPQIDRRLSTVVRSNVPRLPTLSQRQTMQDAKEKQSLYTTLRNRKFSTSIKELEGAFFPTEFEQGPRNIIQTPSPITQKIMAYSPLQKKQTEVFFSSPGRSIREQQPQEEIFEYLKILEANEDLNEQFCYMNRRQLPYSYYIVDYQERNPAEYLTVSLRGITCLKQQQEQSFHTIPSFARELTLYKKIKLIPFFKNYLVVKVTHHWKSIMLRRKFKLKCKYISSHLFSQNVVLQEYLHFLHGLAVDYAGGNFFNFHVTLTLPLADFVNLANAGVQELLKSINKFDNLIEKNLKSSFDKLMLRFRLEERVTLGTNDKKKDDSYLPFDNKRRSMKYTQMAKLKQFQYMIYRMIKYSDLLRFNVKLDLVRKCYANSISDLANLKKAAEDKDTIRLVNWIQMVLKIEGEPGEARLKLTPTVEEIAEVVVDVREQFLVEMCKGHNLMIEKKQEFMCYNLDLEEDENNRPSRYDLKYYILKQPQFINLQQQFQTALNLLLDKIRNLQTKAEESLLRIYNKNVLTGQIEPYLSNQALSEYLKTYRIEYDQVVAFEQSVEYALVLVKMRVVREQVRTLAQEKFKIITAAVPSQVIRRCQALQDRIRILSIKFKENPETIAQYLTFSRNFQADKLLIPQLQSQMQQIFEYEQLVYTYGIRIGEPAKLSIVDVGVLLKELLKRMEEVEENEQKERKKFQAITEEIIPLIEQKAENLLKEIKENTLVNNHTSEIAIAKIKLDQFMKNYEKLRVKKQELFNYQRHLALGHRQLQQYDRMEGTVLCLEEVWNAREHYLKVLKFSQTEGYGKISQLDLQPLYNFLASNDRYYSHLECFQLLAQFKQSTTQLLKVIKLSELISTPTLTSEHIDQLKKKVKVLPGSSIKPELIFHSTSKNTISPQKISKETNIPQLQSQISQVVFLSTQENIVKSQLTEIEEYWRKTKIALISEDIAQNQQPLLHLDDNEELHEKLGYFVVMLKNIELSPHVAGLAHDRAQINGKICAYLRQLLWLWARVQKQWRIILPVMTNYQAVKHQSNVYFDFNNADVLLRKFIRLISEMLSLRRLCEDHKERRFIGMLEETEKFLSVVSKTFGNFLDTKRITYGRFCFMSDQQLIQMLQTVKDARSVSKFIPCCFFSQKLKLDGQVMAAFQSQHETFKTRMVVLKGQPDEIFKAIEDNMKQSLKSMVKKIYPKMKIGMKPDQLIQEAISQVVLMCDRLMWTEMSQKYLSTSTYDDYKLLIRKEQQAILSYLRDSPKQSWIHAAIRAVQLMHLRQIGMELIREQITNLDFKWKQQLRLYIYEEEFFMCHFDGKLQYLCEYRPPTHLTVPTNASMRYLYESYRAMQWSNVLVVGGQEGQGKRQLAQEASAMLGSYSRQVICSSKLSASFLMKIVQGVMAASAWVSFYEFDNLDYTVCAQLLATLYKSNPIEQRNYSLFTLIYHGNQVQQISPYNFLNFSVIEPERQRICQWMLHIYRFKNYRELTRRIVRFLKVVKAFRHRAFGSDLSVINKSIVKAGKKRLELEHSNDEIERRLIAEALRQLVILKEEETKSQCLNIALSAHFQVNLRKELIGEQFQQKVNTLTSILRDGAKGVIVLGERSCKSTAILQAVSNLSLHPIWLYPQSREPLFTPQAIDFLHETSSSDIIIYDANDMIIQWSDLMTAGHLFIQGKRAVLESQAVMELRSIQQCSPSFVGKCQIVYIGCSVVSRWDKVNHTIKEKSQNYEAFVEVMKQLYGKELQGLAEDVFLQLLKFISSVDQILPIKQMQRLIVWFEAMLGNGNSWTRHYGGSCYDVMLTVNYDLIPINANYFSIMDQTRRYLLVPTRQTTVLLLTMNQLLQAGLGVHIIGEPQSGKSCLISLLEKKMQLNAKNTVNEWSEAIKKRLTYVRKEGSDWLVDLQGKELRVVVDDLDLAMPAHLEYNRKLIEQQSIRDKTFKDYKLQKTEVLSLSRPMPSQGKYWSHVSRLVLPPLDKESVSRIFQQNINHQISSFNMNRDVIDLITTKVIKTCLITVDDLTNIIGANKSATLMLSLLKNLLSLPKRQAHCSQDQYREFFRTHYHLKIHQKSHNDKLRYQIRTVEENVMKVIFGVGKIDNFMVNMEGQYRPKSMSQLKEMIERQIPNMVIFDRLLETVVYLINQIKCIDDSVVLLGRRGTGKRFLVQLVSKIIGIHFCTNFSEAILAALKHNKTIYIEQIQNGSSPCYEQFNGCSLDKDLQKFINSDQRELYYSSIAGQGQKQGRLVERCKQYISFLFLCDQRESYVGFSNRRREVLGMPVCLVDQWPAESILNMYSIDDPQPDIHAALFTKANDHLSKHKLSTIPLKTFQKYLNIFQQIKTKMSTSMQLKYKLHKDIHFKFNESFELVTAWQKRVEELKKEIEEAIIKSGENIVANEVANMCLVIFLEQIKDEEEKSTREEAQLKILKYQIEKRLQLIGKVMAKIQKIVSGFRREELGQLKKIYKANRVVYFGVECLCILLKQQTHDQKTINRLLADPNLLMRMKANTILQNRNHQLQLKFKKELQSYTKDILESESELAKIIIEWIKSIIEYWQTCEKQRAEEAKYVQAKASLDESVRKNTELKGQVEYIKKIIEEKLSIVETQLQFKADREVEFNSISKRLDNATKIIPMLKNQAIEAKLVLENTLKLQQNLRGNCILASFTAAFLPMRPIATKQKLLDLARQILKNSSISFSNSFMADISERQIDSLQNLNYFMLEGSSLPKVVFDPKRKFMNFMEENSSEEVMEKIVDNSEEKIELQAGKIYHVAGEWKGDQEKVLVVDWSESAIDEKDAIFLRLAAFKRPQYFQVKKQLQLKINRNLMKVRKLKQSLYSEISQKQMRIIQDDNFREQGQELRKLEEETVQLKEQADEKIRQIEKLTEEINEEATKVITIYRHMKHYKAIDLDVILDACCRQGDNIHYLIRWALSNLHNQHHFSFLMCVVYDFTNQTRSDILRDVITKNTPKLTPEHAKLKKPSMISGKNWELVLKLANYGGGLTKMIEGVGKCPRQFQQWCIDQMRLELPFGLGVELSFIEHVALITNFRDKTYGYLVHQLIHKHLGYKLTPLRFAQIFSNTHYKFPILVRSTIQQLKKQATDLNDSRIHLTRISKMHNEAQMKKVVWKCMQAGQWLVCYDYRNKRDVEMLQSIVYYVMNYDKQKDFKVVVVVNWKEVGKTEQEELLRQSSFLMGVSINMYHAVPSYQAIVAQSSLVEYQIPISNNNSSTFSNKNIFNKLHRSLILCYCVAISKHPSLRFIPFKRITDVLNYIKVKNIPVQFNIFTIVDYIAQIMGNVVSGRERKEVEELWGYLVEERKVVERKIRGVSLASPGIDDEVRNNYKLKGWQESEIVRQKNKSFQLALTELSQIFKSGHSVEEQLTFVRLQLARLPGLITHKQSSNSRFTYFYNRQLKIHNQKLMKLKQMLSQLNQQSVTVSYLETVEKSQRHKLEHFVQELSELSGNKVSINSLRPSILEFVVQMKKQHDFLLYFNPKLPSIIVHPCLVSGLELMVSSYFIDRYCLHPKEELYKLQTYLHFGKSSSQKDIFGEGIFITHLNYKQFNYHHEMKSVNANLEPDGIQQAPIIHVVFSKPREEQGQQVQDLQLQIQSQQRPILTGNLQYSTVYLQWGLRRPCLLTSDPQS